MKTAKHEMRAELTSLDQCSNDQITELKVELRNEMNQLHEISEQVGSRKFIFSVHQLLRSTRIYTTAAYD